MRARDEGSAEFQRRINRQFDDVAGFWSGVYDDPGILGTVFRERRARALDWAARSTPADGARALEVGCGAGSLAVELAAEGYRVSAIDASEEMVRLAREQAASAGVELEVAVGDVHSLDFPDGSFQLVVALGVLPWLHSPRRAVGELARVLEPGGRLVLSCDNRAALQLVVDPRLWPPVHPVKRWLRDRLRLDRPERARNFSYRSLRRMLGAAGLELEARATLQFGPLTVFGWRPLSEHRTIALHRRLQRAADRNVPVVRSAGTQHLVLARRR